MRPPRGFSFLRRLDGQRPALAHVGHYAGDELYVLLDGDGHVREHRRALRPGDGKEVGEVRAHQAEVCVRPLGPLLPQEPFAAAPNIYIVQRAGHRVKTRSVYDGVELVLGAVIELHA